MSSGIEGGGRRGAPPLCQTIVRFPCRMESDEESDSPDSIVPASSPESVLGEEVPRFPLLAGVKSEVEECPLSPVIPIIPKASIPGWWGGRGDRLGMGEHSRKGGMCRMGWKSDSSSAVPGGKVPWVYKWHLKEGFKGQRKPAGNTWQIITVMGLLSSSSPPWDLLKS